MPRAARHLATRYIINRDCYPRRPESVLAPFDVDANAREKRPARPCYSAVMPLSSSPVSIVAVLGLMLIAVGTGGVSAPALAQSPALAAYDTALRNFRAILAERRAQIDAKRPLPNLPGQAVYLARLQVMSTYKDLTDAEPARIGRPNRFGVPPAYFDAAIEPLIEEYGGLFAIMQAPPAHAQPSPDAVQGRGRPRPGHRARQGPRCRRAPTRRGASRWASSSPRPTATRTSATRAPAPTRAACRRAWRRTQGAPRVGGASPEDRGARSRGRRARRPGDRARRQGRPALQSLDRRA